MLLYSIKKRLPFVQALDNLGQRWKDRALSQAQQRAVEQDRAQLPALPAVIQNRNSRLPEVQNSMLEDECAMPWNKIEFLCWFDQNVMGRFSQNDLVTWTYVPEQEFQVPVHAQIIYINEMHHTIKFSKKRQEPKVIVLRNMSGTTMTVCPAEVRHLTDKEKELVDLSNRKTQGTA